MRKSAPWKLIVTIAVALAIIGGLTVYFVPVFKVGTIATQGEGQTTPEEIAQASGVSLGENLLRVDESDVAAKVAGLPWIAKVNVKRSLPATVNIEVAERTAVLFAKRSDGAHLIDDAGTPFLIATPPPGTAEVTGTKDDDPAILRPVVDALGALDPDTRSKLERVDAPSQFEIRLFFTGGKEVYWGASERNHDKALATKTVLQREGNKWNVSAPDLVTLTP